MERQGLHFIRWTQGIVSALDTLAHTHRDAGVLSLSPCKTSLLKSMRKLHWLSWRHIASGPVVAFHLPWQEGKKGAQMILNLVSNKSQLSMTSYKRLQLFSCVFRSVNVLDFDHNLLLRQK